LDVFAYGPPLRSAFGSTMDVSPGTTDTIEKSICPDLLEDPVQRKWVESLPVKERRPVCDLYNKVADLKSDKTNARFLKVDTLVRYLRFKEGKVKDAEKDLRAFLEWRKSFKVDEKVEGYETSQARTIFEKYTCHEAHGVDKNGIPVVYNPMGQSDPDGVCSLIGPQNWLIAHIHTVEKRQDLMQARGEELGICITGGVDVINVLGFEWGRAMSAIDAYGETSKLLDKYYPYRSLKVLLVNAPWVFTACWKIAKGIVSEGTQEALGAYGEKPKEWMPDLSKHVESDQIPVKFGGTGHADWYPKVPPSKIDKNDMLEEIQKKK